MELDNYIKDTISQHLREAPLMETDQMIEGIRKKMNFAMERKSRNRNMMILGGSLTVLLLFIAFNLTFLFGGKYIMSKMPFASNLTNTSIEKEDSIFALDEYLRTIIHE